MRFLLYTDIPSKNVIDRLKKVMESYDISYDLVISGKSSLQTKEMEYDIIMVIGSDKTMLKAIHELNSFEVPFLGVSKENSVSFLMEVPLEKLNAALGQIEREEFHIDECNLLQANLDEGRLIALNEIGIFPSRSATLMKYDLWIDGEYVWRDIADGIIISTPIGSTAYSMSAGGPMVMTNAPVFVVTPVNSLDLTRRPLVISNNSTVEICELSSRCEVEVIADGIERLPIKKDIILMKADANIKFIRLEKGFQAYTRLLKKIKLAKELMKMPPSAKLVMKVLEYEGPLTQKDIIKKTLLPPRTVRYALSLLMKKGLVKKVPNLRDARQSLYYIKV
ncbi:MAG: sugar kinase [Thermoprotei archaeon]|nr:MAG: sugar kinase [Thermoprotei archaeon]RLF19011.1 MAG: sugar kinase [Thermoprotei archaeon]